MPGSARTRPRRSFRPTLGAAALESAIAVCILLIALLPQFLWSDFNGDGAQAFETGRLLLHGPLPFWPAGSGTVRSFPGLTSMLFAYPASWTIRLFGEVEFASRAPMLLALAGVHAGLVTLAEHGERRPPLNLVERWLIWAAIALYTVVMAFSATYNPYIADIGLPGAQDTQLIALFLGAAAALAAGEAGWLVLFGFLTYLALPSGLVLLGLLGLAVALLNRPRPWRLLAVLFGGLVLCFIFQSIGPTLLAHVGLPTPGNEYETGNLLGRFTEIQLTDWQRVLYMVLPCGIAPALALLAWRRQDTLARTLTLVTVVYFLFTYFQAYTALHYYTPVMLLPVAVYWRMRPETRPARIWWYSTAAIGAAVALFFVLPDSSAPESIMKQIGAMIRVEIPGYAQSAPEYFREHEILTLFFPYGWDRSEGLKESPLVTSYYANHSDTTGVAPNYLVLPDTLLPPAGFHRIGTRDHAAAYIRDTTLWAAQRQLRLPVAVNSLFRIAPDVLFRYGWHSHGADIINLPAALKRHGLPAW